MHFYILKGCLKHLLLRYLNQLFLQYGHYNKTIISVLYQIHKNSNDRFLQAHHESILHANNKGFLYHLCKAVIIIAKSYLSQHLFCFLALKMTFQTSQ
jgi:hypothetical protein